MDNSRTQTLTRKSFPSLSLRIDLAELGRIGPGKIQLLEHIESYGSISAAGRAMAISCRQAWALVEELNQAFGRAVVDPQHRGKNGGGAALTHFGRTVVERYRAIERSIEKAAHKELSELWADLSRKPTA